jgi:hypothetical protein
VKDKIDWMFVAIFALSIVVLVIFWLWFTGIVVYGG